MKTEEGSRESCPSKGQEQHSPTEIHYVEKSKKGASEINFNNMFQASTSKLLSF